MKESTYWAKQIVIHQAVAENPAHENWVRNANRNHVLHCRRMLAETLEIEEAEDAVEAAEDAVEAAEQDLENAKAALGDLITAREQRYNQEQ